MEVSAEKCAESLWCKRPLWQTRLYAICAVITICHPWAMFPQVFIFETPDHHCKLPTNASVNASIPWVVGAKGGWEQDKCHMFMDTEHQTNNTNSNLTIPCTNGYDFNTEDGAQTTVVSDFSLVCEDSILTEIYMSVNSVIWAVGLTVGSIFSDIYGRKKLLLITMIFRPLCGVARTLAKRFWVFCLIDFIGAFLSAGLTRTAFILILEVFPKRFRAHAGCGLNIFFALGILLSTPVAWALRNWRHQELALYTPIFALLFFYRFIPESFTWLIANGRHGEVEKIRKAAAKFNKIDLPINTDPMKEEFMEPLYKPTGVHKDEQSLELNDMKQDPNDGKETTSIAQSTSNDVGKDGETDKHGEVGLTEDRLENRNDKSENRDGVPYISVKRMKTTFSELRHTTREAAGNFANSAKTIFSSSKMRKYSLIMFFLWFSNGIIYWALNLTVTYRPGDKYVNYFLNGFAELPAALVLFYLLPKYGRRIPTAVFHFIAGAGLLGCIFELLDTDKKLMPLFTVLNFIGRFGISSSYGCVFLFAPELFPTNVRCFGFGMCGFVATVGTIISPYGRSLERLVPGIVNGLCGCLAIVAGCLALLLPETLGRPLPTTVADVEGWTRKRPKDSIPEKQDS